MESDKKADLSKSLSINLLSQPLVIEGTPA